MILIYIVDATAVLAGVVGIILLLLSGCGVADLSRYCVEHPILLIGIPTAIIFLKYLATTITFSSKKGISRSSKTMFAIMNAPIPAALEIVPFFVLIITIFEVATYESGLIGFLSAIYRFFEVPILFFVVLIPAFLGEYGFYYGFIETQRIWERMFFCIVCPLLALAVEIGLVAWMYWERILPVLYWLVESI